MHATNRESKRVSRHRRTAAAACGLLAAALAIGVPLVGARAEPGYSHIAQFISELGAVGAANAWLVSKAGFAPIGALVLAFLGFASSVLPGSCKTTAGIVGLAAVGSSYLVSAFFPCDPGCPSSGSLSQAIHNTFGLLEYAGALGGLLLLAAALRRSRGWRRLAWACVVAAGIIGVGFATMLIPGLGPVRGLSQRIAEAAVFLWFAYASVFLLRLGDDSRI